MLARQYRKTFGLDVVVARPFNHLGPGQNELFVGSAFAKQVAEIKAGKREPKIYVGNLDPERDFTDVRDVVRAYIALSSERQKEDVFNICTGTSVSIQRVLHLLIRTSGIEAEIIADPERARRNEIPRIVGDSSRLRHATGWKPEVPLEQTVRDLLAYWEERVGKAG
jgi:GDP-4-dehydro-6-deoxy-D-mannose reductase